MTGDRLPPEDHTARYCPGSKLMEDGSVGGAAFYLREGEQYLSVEWLEALNQTSRVDEIHAVVQILLKKLRLGASAAIAVLNVGEVGHYVHESSGFQIRFVHEPEPADFAHSGIFDTDQDEMMIAELIAEKVAESFPVKDLS